MSSTRDDVDSHLDAQLARMSVAELEAEAARLHDRVQATLAELERRYDSIGGGVGTPT